MAIGARPSNVVWMIGWQGGLPVLIGLVLGLALTIGSTRLVQTLLYGVRPAQPSVLALVALTLAIVAAAAMMLPARRATSVNPMVALRSE
jgi:ABC-type antimicrobial peptide transport system permease subunit